MQTVFLFTENAVTLCIREADAKPLHPFYAAIILQKSAEKKETVYNSLFREYIIFPTDKVDALFPESPKHPLPVAWKAPYSS